MRGNHFGLTLIFTMLLMYQSVANSEPVGQLLYSPDQIKKVRDIVRTDEVMAEVAKNFVKKADEWMAYSDEQIKEMLPAPDAVFAYGFSGDPKDNGAWPRFGAGLCSLNRPFAVVSPNTGDVYGTAKEGEPYYDPGTGWVREDGKVFYFRGIWNAYVVRRMHEAIDWLSISYMLTGNDAYAHRALLILDLMATARAERKSIEGPVDFPEPLLKGYGMFSYYSNHAAERTFFSALAFDLIGKSEFASSPSSYSPEISIFENIKSNYFSVHSQGFIENRVSLQNHATAVYATLIAQALLFGRADDLRAGLDACYGFLNNSVDRDGEYYETSGSYSELGRMYGGRMLSLFEHYDPQRFSDPDHFPKRSEFPDELRFGNHPAWRGAAVLSQYNLNIFERPVQYGDARLDRFTPKKTASTDVFSSDVSTLTFQRLMFLKLLYHQTSDPDWKQLCSLLYWQIPEKARHSVANLEKAILQYGPSQWGELPKVEGELSPSLQERFSKLLGQKRIGMIRSGEGEQQRGIFMRGGSNNSHAQNDQMAIQLYSHNLSITGQYGYNLWGTPDHRGYATRAVSHQMLVVDEDLPEDPLIASMSPANIDGYLPFGPAQFLEMSNPGQWPESGLSDYRRQTWLIDVSKAESYFVDIFWVDGGKTHDYVWTAPFVKPYPENAFVLENITLEPVENVWTLAALGGKHQDAPFNKAGHSWGERLEVGSGRIRDVGIAGEKLNEQEWNPPPGNGYGFIWDIKAKESKSDWSATWLLHDLKHSMRMTMLNPDGQVIATGKAPSLTKDGTHDVVIARRKADGTDAMRSRFVSLTQVSADKNWPVRKVEWLGGISQGDVGIKVIQENGNADSILASRSHLREIVADGITLVGKRGFIRRNPTGKVIFAMVSEGTRLETKYLSIKLPFAEWSGSVSGVRDDSITVSTELPSLGQVRDGAIMFSSNPGSEIPYASNEVFTVEDVKVLKSGESLLSFGDQSLISAKIVIDEKMENEMVQSRWPNEIAAVMNAAKQEGRVFDGHLLASEESKDKHVIKKYFSRNKFSVTNSEKLKVDEAYNIMAVQTGDIFRIPTFCELEALDQKKWKVRANVDVRIRLAEGGDWNLKSGDSEIVVSPDIDGFVEIPINALTNGVGVLSR